jgi:hypothetical protein
MPSDRDYKETKLVKQGKKILESPFIELAQWINKEFNVIVLNVYYDLIKLENRPRLNIVFEFQNDEFKFRNGQAGSYNEDKQKVIASKFKELIKNHTSKGKKWYQKLFNNSDNGFDTHKMWVTFSSFEYIARQEAGDKVSASEIKKLKNSLNDKNIWEISNSFGYLTVFYYTDNQVSKIKYSDITDRVRDEYFEILKPYNEFNYFTKDNLYISFDSKENFDNNYDSNWYYYYK